MVVLYVLGSLLFALLVGGVLLYSRRSIKSVPLIPPVSPQAEQVSVEELVRQGRMVEAVKVYREQRGVSLGESKTQVEALVRQMKRLPSKSSVLRQVLDSEIEHQIRSGHLIDAIRLYREKTGVGLKEAKVAIEAWRDRMRAS